MRQASMDYGLFAAECDNCHAGFKFFVDDATIEKARQPVPENLRAVWVVACPHCDARHDGTRLVSEFAGLKE
jgi:hypothetical protein